jgi:hypothetical protein
MTKKEEFLNLCKKRQIRRISFCVSPNATTEQSEEIYAEAITMIKKTDEPYNFPREYYGKFT